MVIDMAVVQTLIGNVKGPQGETGATGATGAKGDAATITVGSVSTTAYGNAARVENVGTENDAILNFTIPQGAPGQRTTTMSGLTLDTVTTSAEEFPVPAVGENGATVWGKVIKWFADGLAAIRSKLDANKVVNSQTVTEAGYALDAQQANPNVSGSLAAQISGLNDSLSTLSFSYSNRTTVITGTPPDGDVPWTADDDCFIMAALTTGSTAAALFAQINIDGFNAFREHGASRNYQYLTTPFYRIPKNAVVTFSYSVPTTGSAVLYKFK
jgi:hypothetical protein